MHIAPGHTPGAIGRITQLHAEYYSRHWGFGLYFEAKVASEMAAFFQRFDPATDGFWTVTGDDGRIEGGIAIDGGEAEAHGAHLRWFIVSDALRHQGAGGRLISAALSFCRRAGHASVYLWTFDGLAPARRLYEKHGFRCVETHPGRQWGTVVTEQRFVLALTRAP